jgi:hypothetical protein
MSCSIETRRKQFKLLRASDRHLLKHDLKKLQTFWKMNTRDDEQSCSCSYEQPVLVQNPRPYRS